MLSSATPCTSAVLRIPQECKLGRLQAHSLWAGTGTETEPAADASSGSSTCCYGSASILPGLTVVCTNCVISAECSVQFLLVGSRHRWQICKRMHVHHRTGAHTCQPDDDLCCCTKDTEVARSQPSAKAVALIIRLTRTLWCPTHTPGRQRFSCQCCCCNHKCP